MRLPAGIELDPAVLLSLIEKANNLKELTVASMRETSPKARDALVDSTGVLRHTHFHSRRRGCVLIGIDIVRDTVSGVVVVASIVARSVATAGGAIIDNSVRYHNVDELMYAGDHRLRCQ